MSGIIGLVGPEAEGCGERLEQARDLMYHRGPDQAGLWGSRGVLLGSRRLAILDLSAAGSQPMLSPDGRLALVFDGEIYNYRELRRELEGSYRFRSHTDSEVLLAGFKVWGWEELLRRIDGMFAFAIWDTQTQTLYAARDRVSKKPFFYALTPKGLVFASTLNALRVLLPDTPKLDPVAIDTYLTYWAVHAPLLGRALCPEATGRRDGDSGDARWAGASSSAQAPDERRAGWSFPVWGSRFEPSGSDDGSGSRAGRGGDGWLRRAKL
jgi:asparagine synthase (glutamine-hydrolysing)